MILLIDNTKNLYKAKMTPNIISVLDEKNIQYITISSKINLIDLINSEKINKIKGVILSGGPLCLTENCLYEDISKNILALTIFKNIPILGICFGFQIMCDMYGGYIKQLNKNYTKEIKVKVNQSSLSIFPNNNYNLFFSHKDYLNKAPPSFNKFEYMNKIIAIENKQLKRYGFQFHPEGTKDGKELIKLFLSECKISN